MLNPPEFPPGADPVELLVNGPPKPKATHGGYEGADRMDRTLALWTPGNTPADAVVLPAKYVAEGRARDLARNDAYVAAGQEFHRDAVVGDFFRFVSEPRYQRLGQTEEWAEEFAEELEQRWEAYAEGENCYLDAQRRMTFTGMVRLAVLTYVAHQEVLASVEWIRDAGRPNRTAILLLDPDRLRDPGVGAEKQAFGLIRGGIEMTKQGEPTAYYIHEESVVGHLLTGNFTSRRVAARKPWGRRQIIHISEPTRINQTRGMSQLTTALRETKMGRKYRDIALQNALVNSIYAATIESELPSEQIFTLLGDGKDPLEAMSQYMGDYLQNVGAYTGNSKTLKMDGVRIPVLPPGTKLNLQAARTPDGIGHEFESSVLRYLAASMGITYEELTRDLRETNYSSIKAGMNITQRTMRARKAMVADRFARQCMEVWFEEEVNNGAFETLRGRSTPDIYESPYNMGWYLNGDWYGTGTGQIDELKETQAALLRVRQGLSTRKHEIARLHGADWRDILRQLAREKKMTEALGLDFSEAENSLNAASGSVNAADSDTSDNTTDTDASETDEG